jgi:hypothetical protein
VDDWGWFFSSEYGRDKMLRTEIESLSYASASAHASNARLSSQLALLQGSLESRLSALSAAFDAYVELGDVREQLSAYGDTAALRRGVASAIEALAAGRSPAPVEVGDGAYWLPHAANAVIALLAGSPDPEAEERARTLSRDADLFVVVTVGALGRGDLVADRVPDLLVADESLRTPQVVLWEAVVAGVYPSATDLLAAIGDRWRPALDAGSGSEWRDWVGRCSGAPDPVGDLRWVRELLAGRATTDSATTDASPAATAAATLNLVPSASPDPSPTTSPTSPTTSPDSPVDPRQRLRAVAGSMVAEGSDAERDLLFRARELRRRIEDPGGPPVPASPGEEPQQRVRDLVRALLDAPDAALRGRAVDWLRPGLRRAVDEIAATPEPAPKPQEVRTPGGSLVVAPSGPDQARLAQVRANVVAAYPTSDRVLIGTGVGAGVLAVGVVVVLVTGASGALLALLLIALVVVAGVALRSLRQRSVARTEVAADTAQLERAVDQGTERARVAQTAYDEQVAAVSQLVRELRSALAPAGVS